MARQHVCFEPDEARCTTGSEQRFNERFANPITGLEPWGLQRGLVGLARPCRRARNLVGAHAIVSLHLGSHVARRQVPCGDGHVPQRALDSPTDVLKVFQIIGWPQYAQWFWTVSRLGAVAADGLRRPTSRDGFLRDKGTGARGCRGSLPRRGGEMKIRNLALA